MFVRPDPLNSQWWSAFSSNQVDPDSSAADTEIPESVPGLRVVDAEVLGSRA
jgi:hypothetical protein